VKFIELNIKGPYLIKIEPNEDDRGYFGRIWCKREFEENGLNFEFLQSNVGYTKMSGTIRGIHYQIDPFQESKLIRCINGSIYDVMIDLRPDSLTFKEWIGIKLTENDLNMIYIPEDFANGYQTLEDNTLIEYFVSEFYSPEHERGIRWDDPNFNIKWAIDIKNISEKDENWPLYK